MSGVSRRSSLNFFSISRMKYRVGHNPNVACEFAVVSEDRQKAAGGGTP